MKIVEPYARMLSPNSWGLEVAGNPGPFGKDDGLTLLKNIEYYARVSHASEDSISVVSWERFLRSVVLSHGDWSVVEHEKVTCEFLVDRGITHELVRHRIASYTQESTRFVNYQKRGGEARFIKPADIVGTEDELCWAAAIEVCENMYMEMCKNGAKPQIARGVLPNSLASKIIMTMNLRAWRHFFVMRTSAEAHPQMRQVTDTLLREFQEKIPILYEDIIPGMRQAEAMRLAR